MTIAPDSRQIRTDAPPQARARPRMSNRVLAAHPRPSAWRAPATQPSAGAGPNGPGSSTAAGGGRPRAGTYWQLTRGQAASAGSQYILADVSLGDVEDTVSAVGEIQPRDYVDVGAQVSGQIVNLPVKVGDEVEKGALLAELDASVLKSQVAANQAQLLNLRAQLEEKNAQLQLTNAAVQARIRADGPGRDQPGRARHGGRQSPFRQGADRLDQGADPADPIRTRRRPRPISAIPASTRRCPARW